MSIGKRERLNILGNEVVITALCKDTMHGRTPRIPDRDTELQKQNKVEAVPLNSNTRNCPTML